jgi:hypothetical protein
VPHAGQCSGAQVARWGSALELTFDTYTIG